MFQQRDDDGSLRAVVDWLLAEIRSYAGVPADLPWKVNISSNSDALNGVTITVDCALCKYERGARIPLPVPSNSFNNYSVEAVMAHLQLRHGTTKPLVCAFAILTISV